MVNVTRGGGIDLGGSMPSMPNFRLAGSRILRLAAVVLVTFCADSVAEGKRECLVERRTDLGLGHFFAVPLG